MKGVSCQRGAGFMSRYESFEGEVEEERIQGLLSLRHSRNLAGNPNVFAEGGFFSLSGLLFFYVFCFFGGYEGESFSPPYCLDP